MTFQSLEAINNGIVHPGGPEADRQSCAFPGVCVLSDGRWSVTFRAAPTKTATANQRVLLTVSEDEGVSWSEPVDPFGPAPDREGRPGFFRTGFLTETSDGTLLAALCWVDVSDPTLDFYNEETEGLLDTRICLAESSDGGRTWTAPQFVEVPFEVPTPLTGPILDLGEEVLALQFEQNKHYYDLSPWRHKSVLALSRDGGKSWPEPSIASDDPEARVFYWDQRPSVLKDGRLLNLFWTFDRKAGSYLNIHARDSRDRGKTWSELWDTGVPGQAAAPFALPGGGTGMVYVDRTNAPALKARVSGDGGRSWHLSTETVLFDTAQHAPELRERNMKKAWSEMSRFAMGLPATASLPGGDTLVVFYAGDDPDRTGIRWARLAARSIEDS